jgi:C_GCAxxG_C_C family probable redox protein
LTRDEQRKRKDESMTKPADKAEQVFREKFNCAQAVFSAFAAQHGLDEKAALRIGAAFGGGISRRGETCGAVTGGLMALGLGRSTAEPEDKERMYSLGQEFMRRFAEKHGTLRCRELIDCDLSTPEGVQKAHDSGVTTTVCTGLVRDAAEIVEEILEAG